MFSSSWLMDIFFRIFGYIFAILCLISAVLQYNDPDPLIWMLIYGTAAAASIAFSLKKLVSLIPLILGFLGMVGFIYVFPQHFQGFDLSNGTLKNVEEGREAFGLLILSIIMFLYAIRIKFRTTI